MADENRDDQRPAITPAISAYFRALGRSGGLKGSRDSKRKAGKLGAAARWGYRKTVLDNAGTVPSGPGSGGSAGNDRIE